MKRTNASAMCQLPHSRVARRQSAELHSKLLNFSWTKRASVSRGTCREVISRDELTNRVSGSHSFEEDSSAEQVLSGGQGFKLTAEEEDIVVGVVSAFDRPSLPLSWLQIRAVVQQPDSVTATTLLASVQMLRLRDLFGYDGPNFTHSL
jgi:hypothetical protein